MNGVLFLIPISIGMGLIGLVAFFWNLRNHQFDDLDGDAGRILSAPDRPAATVQPLPPEFPRRSE